jgi:hypothetical protein
MSTHQVEQVPGSSVLRWGVVTSDSKGGQYLRQPLYETEAQAQKEADRLTVADNFPSR